MTREETIEYWEQFNAEIDGLYDACSDADRDVLVKQREIVEYTISALRQQGRFGETNKSLTMDELREMDGEPVWVICDKGFEPLGLWALVEVCEESIFLTNNLGGRSEYADDVELEDDGFTVYRQKPEEGTV